MELPENSIHSFVIKIWLEETAAEAGRARWRGHITHVATGQRHYVNSMGDLPAFVAPYLGLMGVDVDVESELQQWLHEQRAD
jgi:hypothetical protein